MIALLMALVATCKKPYEPTVLIKGDNYLVVDGFINTGTNGITTLILSRTKNLTDTVVSIPERNANVRIVSAAGSTYSLQEQAEGVYNSGPLQLNGNTQYGIQITTSNGKQYASDLVVAKPSPPIDSVNWVQDTAGVHVFVNTHDAQNNTKYYRWQYVQTWEYHAQLETAWGLKDNVIYPRPLNDQVWICYRTTNSTRVLLGSSAALSQDVISRMPLFTVPANDSTLAQRMSILVKQYALTPAAHAYWQIIQKNSEQLGTLFDLQPSQLEGNLHCVSNPGEPVVGFITAGTESEKRIFISVFDLQDWRSPRGSYNCLVLTISQDPNDFSRWTYPDTTYVPWYFATGSIIIAKKVCIDCRESGGTTVKPSFW
ncbi:MAG TPA: DUF4249 domain-containing protein [Chitinophagaceae bacterium]|nr:DUF4249 domain-containing protein [Chitinophagaceae bacterium]